MKEPQHPARILFTGKHPLTASLGLKFFPNGEHGLRVEVAAPSSFLGADGRFLHSGFASLILDTVLGSCAIGNLEKIQPIATIKLSCNHLRRFEVGEMLVCNASWGGEERSISYVSGDLRRKSDNVVLSMAIGMFMVGTASQPLERKL